jgi:hypothetical protein
MKKMLLGCTQSSLVGLFTVFRALHISQTDFVLHSLENKTTIHKRKHVVLDGDDTQYNVSHNLDNVAGCDFFVSFLQSPAISHCDD